MSAPPATATPPGGAGAKKYALPGARRPPKTEVLEESAEKVRKGTLFFLSTLDKNYGIPTSVVAWLGSAAIAGQGVKTLVDESKPENVTEVLSSIKDNGLFDPISGVPLPEPDTQNAVLKSILDTASGLVEKLVDQFPGDAGSQAAEWISQNIPDIVASVLGALAHLGAAFEIGTNLKTAVMVARDFFKTRHLEDGIVSGQPKIVIESVRDQIAKFSLKGLAKAVEAALMAGITTTNPVIASVVGAVKGIMTFIIKAFLHFRECWKMNKVLVQAKEHWERKLWERAAEFQDWYTQVIKDLPIVSCYCLAMPMTGSYFGFLSMVSKEGCIMTQEQLKKNYDLFEDVKTRAREFIGLNSVKWSSQDAMVQQSILVAQGGTIKLEPNSEAAILYWDMVEQDGDYSTGTEYAGLLEKPGKYTKKFIKRWFMFKGGELAYSDTEKGEPKNNQWLKLVKMQSPRKMEGGIPPLGELPLTFVLTLVNKKGDDETDVRVFTLRALKDSDFDLWKGRFSQALKHSDRANEGMEVEEVGASGAAGVAQVVTDVFLNSI